MGNELLQFGKTGLQINSRHDWVLLKSGHQHFNGHYLLIVQLTTIYQILQIGSPGGIMKSHILQELSNGHKFPDSLYLIRLDILH
jgi:hypothetical protein